MNQSPSITPLNFNMEKDEYNVSKSYSDGMDILKSLDRYEESFDTGIISPISNNNTSPISNNESLGFLINNKLNISNEVKTKPSNKYRNSEEKQTVVYIERPCTCTKDIDVEQINKDSNVNVESIIIVKNNFQLSGETTVFIEGAKTITVTLPENIPQQKGSGDYGIEGQMARQVTIRGVDSSTNHIIESVKNQKIGQYNSYRLAAGKTVSFVGFGDNWYPL